MPATSRATVVLPVPGLPVKTRCRVMVGLLQTGLGAQLLHPQQGDLPVDLALDRGQPDERVELVEQLLAASGPARGRGRPSPASGRGRGRRAGCRRAARDRPGGLVAASGTPATVHERAVAGAAVRRAAVACTAAQLGRGGDRGVAETRIVGSPRLQAAEATSASACA